MARLNEELTLIRDSQQLVHDINTFNSKYCDQMQAFLSQSIGTKTDFSKVLDNVYKLKTQAISYKTIIADYMDRVLRCENYEALPREEGLAGLLYEYCENRCASMNLLLKIAEGLQKKASGRLSGYSSRQYQEDITELNKLEEESSSKGILLNTIISSWEASIPL